jgi:hypothetical protein
MKMGTPICTCEIFPQQICVLHPNGRISPTFTALSCGICGSLCELKFNGGNPKWVCSIENCRKIQE